MTKTPDSPARKKTRRRRSPIASQIGKAVLLAWDLRFLEPITGWTDFPPAHVLFPGLLEGDC